MKTVRKDQVINRLDNETAERKVKNEGFQYTTKAVWKKQVRDVNVTKEENPKKLTKKVK